MRNTVNAIEKRSNHSVLKDGRLSLTFSSRQTSLKSANAILYLESYIGAQEKFEKTKQMFSEDLRGAIVFLAKRAQLQIEDIAGSFPTWEFKESAVQFQNLQHLFSEVSK